MPFILLLWLLLPWLLDLWLTVTVADAVGVSVWYFFLASAALGLVMLVWEWRRVQTYWRALRRLEGSPWQLLASARRGLAALLLILPGLGSDVLALLLLMFPGGRRVWARNTNRRHANEYVYAERQRAAGRRTAETAYQASPGVIEGEFRREE
ncbi:MAG: FxsA family protein [Burkholderiales bacterium]|jgi:UPF0716 protein FxsA|nr:FxsA family protein [Burkholderiales bacterium]